jgi:hypothetical protein
MKGNQVGARSPTSRWATTGCTTGGIAASPNAGIVAEGTTSGERMHKARHSAGQRLLDHTGNLKAVQQLLGHESIATTGDIYVDWDENALPPENAEAEASVIGAVLLAPTALAAGHPGGAPQARPLLPRTPPPDLARRAPGRRRRRPDRPAHRVRAAPRRRRAREAGGQAYVYSLPNLVPSASHVRRYARIVYDKAVWRERSTRAA